MTSGLKRSEGILTVFRFLQLSKYKLRRPSRSSIDDGSSLIAVSSKLSTSSFPMLHLIFGKLVSFEQPLQ
ncbi:unnamed protein product, partial [Vitis vinifera]